MEIQWRSQWRPCPKSWDPTLVVECRPRPLKKKAGFSDAEKEKNNVQDGDGIFYFLFTSLGDRRVPRGGRAMGGAGEGYQGTDTKERSKTLDKK